MTKNIEEIEKNIDTVDKKSSPFIIWTFRRTGGTNISSQLFESSNFKVHQHEPFNAGREYQWIRDHWIKHKDKKHLYSQLDKILSKKILMKHCIEVVPDEFNTAIAELSNKYGYKHLFLYREDPVDRLLSLKYAIEKNIWSRVNSEDTQKIKVKRSLYEKIIINFKKKFKKKHDINYFLNHEIDCRSKMQRIYKILSSTGNNVLIISFEQLFNSSYSESSSRFKKLFQQLIGEEKIYNQEVFDRLFYKGAQNTKSEYTHFSNSQEFINKIKQFPHFSLKEKAKTIDGQKSYGPIISLIIPVYNVSTYIKRCIDSVVNQTYSNIEIIVIDDCSQDDSISKVKEFKDNRIKILSHKCNRGSAAARNTGMDAAKGEFIIFLDSDDYIDCDLIKKCIERQQKNDVDCVVFNTQFVDDNYNIWVSPLLWNQYFFGNGIENGSIDDDGTKTLVGWDVAAWSKFIRLDYLKQNKIYFLEEHRYFEDHYFSAKLYLSKIRFSYIDEKLHYYFKRSSIKNKSITQLNSPIMGVHRSQVFRDVCLLIESVNHKYKNIFYPAYFETYKNIIYETFNQKKHRKEIYENLRRVFQGIKELDIVKNMNDISNLDLAFLMAHYDYDQFMTKFGNINNYSVSDIKEIIPPVFHDRLEGWTKPALIYSTKKIFDFKLVVSAALFLALCICKFKFLHYRNFLLKLRDFHLIYYLGEVNYLNKSKGIRRWLRIFDYVIEGEKSGNKINDKFEASEYIKQNPDLAFMNMGLYPHFLFYAGSQKRNIKGML